MSNTTKTEPHNKPNILHLLEYCRIDRAAELLGCEVCDLLHLAEVRKISLYWNFKGQPATCAYSTIEPSVIECGLSAITMDEPDGGLININSHSYVWLDDDEKLGTNQQITVRLFGLWDADARFNEFVNFLVGSITSIDCRSKFAPGRYLSALLPDGWQEPPVEELCILKGDLIRLRDAINDRESTDPSKTGLHGDTECIVPRQSPSSPKMCAAIMELLKVVGFSDAELSGSAQELQNKVAARNLSPTIASAITERTIRIWRRAAEEYEKSNAKAT